MGKMERYRPQLGNSTKSCGRMDASSQGFMKLNFDGSRLGNPGPTGIGGLLRNELGEVICASVGPIGVADATEVEVCTAHQGIKLVARDCLDNVMVEGDSLNVIHWLEGSQKPPWRFDRFFYEIFNWSGSFSMVFHHVHRSANKEPDSLAGEGVSKDSLALFDSLPP
ncbi:uncharacterized protein LOC143847935 [Tasmannia lanceolata]|uniref:uncharacterized protein LOC143847935 n=1 Tax=Tasmannia lanceolata TaxID=3420 RepID=UPI004062F0A3